MTTVDANVATVLQSLEAHAGLVERTIVVLHGDHGFNLGEQNRWGKQGAPPMPKATPIWRAGHMAGESALPPCSPIGRGWPRSWAAVPWVRFLPPRGPVGGQS